MRKYFCLVVVLSLLSAACSKQLQDYVADGPTKDGPNSTTDSTSNPAGIRITAGANTASGSQVKSRFAITTSDKPVLGTQLKGYISFHQTRPQ